MDENPRITDLRKKLEKDPGSRLFAQLAEELRKEGKHDEAIAIARRGLEKNPNYPSARLTLARALLDSGRPREARPELEQVVKVSPDNILAGRLLGDALEDLGLLAEAIQQIERTLVFSPGDKPMTEKVALLRASIAERQAADARQAAAVARPVAPAPASSPAPAPEPAPEVASSVALDRDLASGTFSPGSLMAADLQKHFESQAAEPPVADAVMEQTLGFGEVETAAFAMGTAETVSLEPAPALPEPAPAPSEFAALPLLDTDRTQIFAAAPTPEPLPVALPEPPPPAMAAPEDFRAEALPEESDIGGQTLPLTSLTLADLYLQQGLKAEASAVLSQVVMDEPDNAQARSKLAAVSLDLDRPLPEPPIPDNSEAQAEPVEAAFESLAEPVAEPEPVHVPLAVPAPVPVPVAMTEPKPQPKEVPQHAAAPIQTAAPKPIEPPIAAPSLTRVEIRQRTILALTAFRDAAEREAIHQRASELSIR